MPSACQSLALLDDVQCHARGGCRSRCLKGWTQLIRGFAPNPRKGQVRCAISQPLQQQVNEVRFSTEGGVSRFHHREQVQRRPQPEVPFELDQALLVRNLKSARRGAAGGPSGLTAEHLRPLLDSEAYCDKFGFLCQALAQARIPHEVLSAVRMSRITAL